TMGRSATRPVLKILEKSAENLAREIAEPHLDERNGILTFLALKASVDRGSVDALVPTTTIAELASRYEVLLLDAYGVLVDSGGALPNAADIVAQLLRERRRFLVLTNDASKSPERSSARFRACGIEVAPEQVLTSGSLLKTHAMLRGRGCVVLGPEDSE